MPTPTYIGLANTTLTGTASVVTLSSIPNTYRDLVIVIEGAPTARPDQIRLRFNSDSGNNYVTLEAGGNGTSAYTGSYTDSNAIIGYLTTTARINSVVNVLDYSTTDKEKAVFSRQSAAAEATTLRVHRWANTSAITSVSISTQNSTFAPGFTFALYGIGA